MSYGSFVIQRAQKGSKMTTVVSVSVYNGDEFFGGAASDFVDVFWSLLGNV